MAKLTYNIPKDYTVIDLETTGTSPAKNEIIEIACLKYRQGEQVEAIQQLVRPRRRISYFIQNFTGITNEMVADAPMIEEVLPAISAFLQGETIVGHNVNFDMNFLKAQGVNFDGWYLDTLYLSRKLLKNVSCHKLEYLCDYFGIVDTHHRAASDCLMTNALMYRLSSLPEYQKLSAM